MSFTQAFRLAIKSLMMSKMRALLTMLGIIIGVGAVIVITSLGNGMQMLMNQQFEQLGANMLQVQIFGNMQGSSRMVYPDDMYELVEKYPEYLSGVSPFVSVGAVVRQGEDEFQRTSISGVSEVFYRPERGTTLSGETLAEGRFLTFIDVERHQSVCVIGSYLAKHAFGGDALGETLTVNGIPFTVIGVLAETADSTEGSGDDILYMPYTGATRITGSAYVSAYLFNSTSQDTAVIGRQIIQTALFHTFQDSNGYMVISSAEMMGAMNTMVDTLMVVLVAIAAISLLVGGIGIMNIMLVSVTERTREIGIRKSLGAKRRDIRGQFLIEAGTTSAIGGMLGIFFGMGLASVASAIVTALMEGDTFSATPTLGSILVAFGVSVGIGVLFGYLPANKAAGLNPIDALRYD